jgi:cell wall-associated NlpC family hydrolase
MGRSWDMSSRVFAGVMVVLALAAFVVDGRAQVKTGNDIGAITGTTHTAATPPPKATNRPDQQQVVKDVAGQFKGTHDLAGAAEALVNKAGNQFKYHYGDRTDPRQKDFGGMSSLDDFYSQRLMICYEFVHYVAYLASNQGMAQNNPKVGADAGGVKLRKSTQTWDGKSEIPRGKIVTFKAWAFNNNSGYYHVGISLGGGKIAHNSSNGNVQISDISEVNSIGYKEIEISDYDWKSAGEKNPGDPDQKEPEPTETIKEYVPPPDPPEKSVGQLPDMQKALDEAAQGIHLADAASCCGDPLGEVMMAPTLTYAPQYQLFVTGEPLDIVIGGDAGGRDDDRWDGRPSPSRIDSLLTWLLRGIVATLEARQAPARVGVAVVATGASSGDAFMVQIAGPLSGGGRVLASDGLVLAATTQTVAMPKASPTAMASGLQGFCAEFVKEPPPPGTVYKVADAKQQQRLKPMRRIMRAANQLATASKLHPDSSIAGYATSIKQYAVWTRLEGWNRDAFFKNFVERTRKNALAMKQPWTDAVESQVKKLLPNRWDDIQAVLKASDALAR